MADMFSSGSESDDGWQPRNAVKPKTGARRAIISSDDSDSDSDSCSLVGATSEEDDEGTTGGTSGTQIIAGSDDEEGLQEADQNQRSADSGIKINDQTPVLSSRPTAAASSSSDQSGDCSDDEKVEEELNNSRLSEASTLAISENEEDVQRPPTPPAKERKHSKGKESKKVVVEENWRSKAVKNGESSLTVTSTPVVKGYKIPPQFDITAIPSFSSNFNATLVGGSDESPEESPRKTKRQSPQASGSGSGRKGAAPLSTLNEDMEDMLVAGLNDITLKGRKDFTFRRKGDADANAGAGRKAVGATSLDYFDEEDEDDESISANFDFDDNGRGSNNDDSEVQVVAQKPKAKPEPPVVILDDSDDVISGLSEQMRKLPLGKQATVPPKDQPRKAIFLNEPPPIEKRTYSYDPSNVKHQEFYGDVQRTVSQLAKTIEEMPMPDDENTDEISLPKGLVSLFDHQSYGLRWLSWREREFPGGGILADEMGLGKTIMTIALIMKSKRDYERAANENWVDTEEVGNCIPSKTTLVVCPVGCIIQWNEEINNKGKGLRVNMYHGPNRTTSAAQLAQYDVVLTTYHTIIHEIPKDGSSTRSPLKRLYWRRIVLDEAHNIRNPKTAGSQSICQLKARHRWAVTGTPIHNKPEDFFAMCKFLKFKPFDDPKVWDFWIGLKSVRKADDAKQRLHILGKALILRRTKAEVEDAGGNVQKIPPKTIQVVELELSEGEKRIYDYLAQFAKDMFEKFMQNKEERARQLNAAAMTYTADRRKKKPANGPDGTPTDIRFSHVFALIVRLRQCSVLPYLIHTMLEDEEVDEDVSFDELNDDHIVSKLNPSFDRLYESTKIKKILFDLDELRRQAQAEDRPMDKVVVVSQWTNTLEIIYEHLRRRRFSCVFITGKEKNTDRSDNMKKFNTHPEKYHICLLSLMAGGVGLNLVGGNHVFFVEPHWNPQLELQAQDRCHRFGQTKDVTVRRYVVKDTIESRILAIQEDKIDLADGVLNSVKKTRGGGLSIPQLQRLFQ